MRVITICSTIAIILSPFALSHPEKLRARTGETKDENKDHISIAEEWLDNNRRQVPQWLPEPPKPNTKRLTLCKHNPPAVVRPAPASVPPPTRDSCSLLLQSLESEWLYFEKWTLVTEAGSSPPKQQPWIPAQYMKCVFLVTGWQPPKDGVGQKKKLTIEVGNDDVRQLVRESLEHHILDDPNPMAPAAIGAKGSMDCQGTHVEWQLRKMDCPEGPHGAMTTWCKY